MATFQGKKTYQIKKKEIDAMFQNFAWETLPFKESLNYLASISKELMDFYINYRKPLR